MCKDICEVVEEVQPGRVFVVEDGGIWFSGMNANVGRLVEEVAEELEDEGYEVGTPGFDDAAEFGGVFLPVEEASAVDDETHYALVSPPGGHKEREEAHTAADP